MSFLQNELGNVLEVVLKQTLYKGITYTYLLVSIAHLHFQANIYNHDTKWQLSL